MPKVRWKHSQPVNRLIDHFNFLFFDSQNYGSPNDKCFFEQLLEKPENADSELLNSVNALIQQLQTTNPNLSTNNSTNNNLSNDTNNNTQSENDDNDDDDDDEQMNDT